MENNNEKCKGCGSHSFDKNQDCSYCGTKRDIEYFKDYKYPKKEPEINLKDFYKGFGFYY
jgi:ribosomal protein L37E